jgi:hypothetical protein
MENIWFDKGDGWQPLLATNKKGPKFSGAF